MKPGFLDEMEEAFAVRQHVILALNTEDRFYFPEEDIMPSNLNYFIASYFARHGYRVAQYLPSMGARELCPSGMPSAAVTQLSGDKEPSGILNGLAGLLRNTQDRWIILVLHAERIAPNRSAGGLSRPSEIDFAEAFHTLVLDDGIAAGCCRLVLVTYSGMPDELIARSRGCRLVEVGLPSQEERLSFIQFLEGLSGSGDACFGCLEKDVPVEELVRITAGMPLSGIEAAYRAAGRFKKSVNRDQIRLAKARDIRNLARDLIEVSEPQEGFEVVAGLTSIKSYLMELITQIKAGQPGVPQAILLQGVPGCGKSHLVKALAGELNWPLLEMRNVRSPFVGQSEMNLDHVIRVVEQLQPAILFFDEIDQSIGQRSTGASGDSGTSERLLARIFTWLGSLHLRGRILFLGATNRPDMLDPALLDRFGVSIPFLKPGYEELQGLIPLLLKRFERMLNNFTPDEAAHLLKPLSPTGRSVQEILVDAGLHADREFGRIGTAIEKRHLEKASANQLNREDEVEMTFIAMVSLSLSSLQSFLPWNDSNGLRAGAEIPPDLLKLGIVMPDGRLDKNRLSEVITELKERRYNERMLR